MGYLFEFTGNWGDTLFDSIDKFQIDRHWDDMCQREYDYRKEAHGIGGEQREVFVERIMEELIHEEYEDPEKTVKEVAVIAGIFLDDEANEYVAAIYDEIDLENEVTKWLQDNDWPLGEINEEDEIVRWLDNDWDNISECCQYQWDDDILYNKEDDLQIAMEFEFIEGYWAGLSKEFHTEDSRLGKTISDIETKYKPFHGYKKVEEGDKMVWKDVWNDNDKKYTYKMEISKVRDAQMEHRESIILISGFHDDGGNENLLDEPMDRHKVPRCPNCDGMVTANSLEAKVGYGFGSNGKWDEGRSVIDDIKNEKGDDYVLEVLSLCEDVDVEKHYLLSGVLNARRMAAELSDETEERDAAIRCPVCEGEYIAIAELYFKLKGEKMPDVWTGRKMAERLVA